MKIKTGGMGLALAATITATAANAGINVLCSTFPVYQITRNVAAGREGLKVDLLLPAALGCPHHYTLTPGDMRGLESADIIVINGLGMDEFVKTGIRRAGVDPIIIDASAGIDGILTYPDAVPARRSLFARLRHAPHRHSHDHSAHAQANPHLFVSPRMRAGQAAGIAAGLAAADPEGAGVYERNARAYTERLLALADEAAELGRRLKNNRVVQPHGVFDYLARDIGIEIVAVTQPHGREPSAAEMIAIVAAVRTRDAGAVLTEPQYPQDAGRAIARETGIPVAVIDPVAAGPSDAPLDYYETVMRRNFGILGETLGLRP